jgi:prepilin-type N-terminal cleavage/methylation domain-containing protein
MSLRELLRDERGFTLPELLVGMIVSTIIMLGVGSVLWTANNVQSRAGDEAAIASYMASLGIRFERDVAMAAANAPAKTQAGTADCSTSIDLGSVTYQMVASSDDGPYWLVRNDGSGPFPMAKLVTQCTWQILADTDTSVTTGQPFVQLDITLVGVRHTQVSQTLKGAPRLW